MFHNNNLIFNLKRYKIAFLARSLVSLELRSSGFCKHRELLPEFITRDKKRVEKNFYDLWWTKNMKKEKIMKEQFIELLIR